MFNVSTIYKYKEKKEEAKNSSAVNLCFLHMNMESRKRISLLAWE
jgi:hypothetical protein